MDSVAFDMALGLPKSWHSQRTTETLFCLCQYVLGNCLSYILYVYIICYLFFIFVFFFSLSLLFS